MLTAAVRMATKVQRDKFDCHLGSESLKKDRSYMDGRNGDTLYRHSIILCNCVEEFEDLSQLMGHVHMFRVRVFDAYFWQFERDIIMRCYGLKHYCIVKTRSPSTYVLLLCYEAIFGSPVNNVAVRTQLEMNTAMKVCDVALSTVYSRANLKMLLY